MVGVVGVVPGCSRFSKREWGETALHWWTRPWDIGRDGLVERPRDVGSDEIGRLFFPEQGRMPFDILEVFKVGCSDGCR